MAIAAPSCGSSDGKKATSNHYSGAGEGGTPGDGGGSSNAGKAGKSGSAAQAGDASGGQGDAPSAGAPPNGGTGTSLGGDGQTGSGGADSLDADGCGPAYKNCESSNPDCETDVSTVTTCGACDVHCDAVHGLPVCENFVCVVPPGKCDAGYADCDNDGTNGCEVTLGTDSNNCGTCGRVCQGGTPCSAGMCAWVTVAEIGSSIAGEDVYFTSDKIFFSSPSKTNTELGFTSRNPATLPATPTWIASTSVNSLTGDAAFVYFSRDPFGGPNSIRKVAADGSGMVQAVNDNIAGGSYLRSNATAFFMLSPAYVPTAISTLAKTATGSPLPIVTNRNRIYQYLVTPTKLVWIEGDTPIENPLVHNIYVAPLAGGSGTAITKIPGDLVWDGDHYKNDMASDGEYLYWSVYGAGSGKVRRYKLDGSALPEDLAFDLPAPTSMLVDAKYVYYLGSGNSLYRLLKVGGALPEIVSNNTGYLAYLDLVDDLYVWGHDNNSLAQIRRTPK